MAFTQATITHLFKNSDGTPASGSVRFTLTNRITNGTTTIAPTAVIASLNSSGVLSVQLWANNDPATIPTSTSWRVQLEVLGSQAEEFFITVPTGGGTFDLGALLPQQPLAG
jgi:hypothetical protein